jgi:hypothetical protein
LTRRRVLVAVTVVMALAVVLGDAGSSKAVSRFPSSAPQGVFRLPHDATSATDLHVFGLNGHRYGVTTPIHVMTFTGPAYRVTVGLAHRAVDGGLETPVAMCRSTPKCVAAVNGDFFAVPRRRTPNSGDAVGGIVRDCVLLHTPEISHQQANLDASTVSGGFSWNSTLLVNGVSVPVSAVNQELPLRYERIHLPLTGTLLFTSDYGARTPSVPGWVTYEFEPIDASVPPTAVATTSGLELIATTTDAVHIASGHVDIAAFAGSPLEGLQVGDVVEMTTTSNAGCNSIGGHPILLNAGAVVPVAAADTYLSRPYARTVIGWTATGATVIMTVDGRDGVSGATAPQLVKLLQALNVVTALNLDGGMSSSFYAYGRVYDRPPHGSVRPVSTALLVVKST